MPGPQPKHHLARQRRNKTPLSAELVPLDPDELVIPELPERIIVSERKREDGTKYEVETAGEWHPQAVAGWYEVWSSAMRSEYLDGDYAGIRALLALEHEFWSKVERGRSTSFAHAEVRMARQQLGLTPMARRSLQWTVAQTQETVSRTRRALRAVPTPAAIEGTAEEEPTIADAEVVGLLDGLGD